MTSIARRVSSATTRSRALAVLGAAILVAAAGMTTPAVSASETAASRPTVVLVHGAFAESSSSNPVTTRLLASGYPVIAVANPLRSVKGDTRYLVDSLDSIGGLVIVVGPSDGGNAISDIPTASTHVRALVFVPGVAPDVGETAATPVGKFPGSMLGPTLAPPVMRADGNKDLDIRQDQDLARFAADVPSADAKLMATTQRPVTEAAPNEPGGPPAWKTTPSWFRCGSVDKNIPPAVHAYMAKRAGTREACAVTGASYAVMIRHPDALVKLVDDVARFVGDNATARRRVSSSDRLA